MPVKNDVSSNAAGGTVVEFDIQVSFAIPLDEQVIEAFAICLERYPAITFPELLRELLLAEASRQPFE